MTGRLTGRPVRRIEDPRLLRGVGAFVDDLPGDLHVAFVRSLQAHATVSVDARAASALPGVEAIVSGPDLGAVPVVPTMIPHPDLRPCPEPAIATDRVRYAGQVVAAVIAADAYRARDAALEVEVQYDVEPVVVTTAAALAPGAPLLHPGLGDNLAGTIHHLIGDPAAAIEAADTVLVGQFDSHRYNGQPLETRGVVALAEPATGLVTLWTSTQWPHTVRDGIAEALGLPTSLVRVVAPDVGGGFGIKQEVYPEEVLLALLAQRLPGRRLKWSETRSEHFVAANHSREQQHRVELAASRDGTIRAMRVHARTDMGAYVRSLGLLAPSCTAAELPGPYRIRDYEVVIQAVLTNKTPIGVYRGAGLPEAVYATERAVDRLAAELAIDPAELRRSNFIRADEFPWRTGLSITQLEFTYDSGDYAAVLDDALTAIDYPAWRSRQAAARDEGRLVGIGLASFVLLGGLGPFETAEIRLQADGRCLVRVGASPHGQGVATVVAQVVADMLAVPVESITVEHGDTALISEGGGTYASRSGVTASGAARLAAERLREAILSVAGGELEIAAADLELRAGGVAPLGAAAPSITLADVAARAGGEVRVEARFEAPDCTFSFGTHAAVVEIDPVTGQLSILDYAAATDPGPLLNPMIAEAQIVGGLAQGLAGVLEEELVYDADGQLVSGTFADYRMPRATDTVEAKIRWRATPSPLNPLGVKGLGEAGTVGAPAAVANAVEDAIRWLGLRVHETPLTPPRLAALLRPHLPTLVARRQQP